MGINESFVDDFYFQLVAKGNYAETLRILCSAFDAHCGSIMSVTNAGGRLMASHEINLDSISEYHGDLNKDDFMLPFVQRNESDKVLIASSLVDLAGVEKTYYFQAVDKASDIYDKLT